MRFRRLFLFALSLFVAVAPLAVGPIARGQGGGGPKPMTPLDLFTVSRISDAQLSPDGRQVSYNLATADWNSNRFVPQVFVQPAGARQGTRLTGGSSARWSPDSSTLFYLSGGQIHLVPAAGGPSRPLTKHATSVMGGIAPQAPMTLPQWSPDGTTIYFVAADPQTGTRRDRLDGDVTVFGQTDFAQQHLWKVDVASGAEERITSGDWSIHGFRLSRDGRRFAVLRTPTSLAVDHYRAEVWVMDVNGANARALTSNLLYELDAELSPDNSQVWFVVDANEKLEPYYGQTLFVVPAAGGTPRMVAPQLGHTIESAAWAPDGKSIFATVNLGVHHEIFRIDAATGAARQLTDGQHGMPTGLNLVSSANRLIFIRDEPTRLGDAWTLPLEGGTPTRVTGVFDSLATTFALPRQEKVSWKAADGVTIEGVLFYPLDYRPGQRYPLVVQLHGGPGDSDKFGFGAGFIFNYVPVLAAKGYAVLRPNYRGSSGYGSVFIRDIIGHYFHNMHTDVIAGVDAMVQQGIADPDRLAVSGLSAGAHLVNKLITFTDRFKAASSTAGVANWISLMAQTDAFIRRTFWMGGNPWQPNGPVDLLWNHSPIKDISKAKTPTLFSAGQLDARIPKEQAMEMFRGLEANKVPTRLIIANGEGHQWVQLRSQLTHINEELGWFERYVTKRPYEPARAPAPPAPPPAR